MGHYFEYDDTLESKEQTFSYRLLGEEFVFVTDRGVFSKDTIDFGSRLLIESYVYEEGTKSILDVGCGYGPISLALAKNFDGHVTGIDVNEKALELADRNARNNMIENVTFLKSYIFDSIDHRYDSIITNPPIRAGKQVVHSICLGAVDHLNDGGTLWVVIQKKQGAPSLIERLKEVYASVRVVSKAKGYFIICATKG